MAPRRRRPKRQKRPNRSTRPLRKKAPAAVESKAPLPDCEGPKLGKFQHGSAAIQFVDLLSAETPGVDGHVFEVIIKSKHYALKMVKYKTVEASSETHMLIYNSSSSGSLLSSILQLKPMIWQELR